MGVQRRTTKTEAAPAAEDYAPDEGLTPEPEDDTNERSSSVPKRGWGAARQKIKDTSKGQYADDWTPPEGTTLIKFLESEPFASLGVHWVDEIKEGKRTFYCREEDCPLCGVGHRPSANVYFNVVPLTGDDVNSVKALKAGPMLTDIIEQENNDRGGPLDRHYWALKKTVTKSGKGKKTNYSLNVVKGRDLAEDWELDADEVARVLQGAEPYQPEIFRIPSREELQEIVDEHLADD